MASVETVDLLSRPMYGMSQVDRLLGLYGGTARRWIDGYYRAGKPLPPIVRPETTGDEIVTWGEFVEARLLAEYRDKGVPISRMRRTVEKLREQFGDYPLARANTYLDDDTREVVYRIQADSRLPKKLSLVVQARSGQVVLSPSAERFTENVDWDDRLYAVARIHPMGRRSPVVLDPLIGFGRPVIRAVRTEAIAEQFRAGDSVRLLARIYQLSEQDIRAALEFEKTA